MMTIVSRWWLTTSRGCEALGRVNRALSQYRRVESIMSGRPYNTSTIQIQYKYNANTNRTQLQYKYNPSTIQIIFVKYNTHPIQKLCSALHYAVFTVQCLIRQWSCRGSHGVFVCLYFCIFVYFCISAVQCCSVDDKAVGRRERWCVCSSTPDTRGQYEARALFFLPASNSCLLILFFPYLKYPIHPYLRYPIHPSYT